VVEIRALIKELADHCTVVFSSHILSEVSQLCRRVIIINHGHLLAVDTPAALGAAMQDSRSLRVSIEASQPAEVLDLLKGLPGVARVDRDTTRPDAASSFLIQASRDVDLARDLCQLAFSKGWVLREIIPKENTLEDTFLKLMARENQAQ